MKPKFDGVIVATLLA